MTFATTRETVFGEQATGMLEEIMPTGFIGEGSHIAESGQPGRPRRVAWDWMKLVTLDPRVIGDCG